MTRAHARAEGQLLHGSDAVLRHSPTVLLLERAPEDGTGPARSTMRVAGTTGAIWAVGHGRKYLVLAC